MVIEGIDGAGKRTLADGLVSALTARGAKVAQWGFPRYGVDIHADLVRDALYGRLGDLADSVHGMALLFALDRRAAADRLGELRRDNDVVLLDRYVASNAAYGAARLHEDASGCFVEWVRALEVDRFSVPVPDVQLLLQVPVDVAAARADDRAQVDCARIKDLYEIDTGLQARCAAVYGGLAAAGWLAPWLILDDVVLDDTAGTGTGGTTPSDVALQMLEG
ncbi:MAG: dTMP kinase [Pseudonocardiaceae bacterium]